MIAITRCRGRKHHFVPIRASVAIDIICSAPKGVLLRQRELVALSLQNLEVVGPGLELVGCGLNGSVGVDVGVANVALHDVNGASRTITGRVWCPVGSW